MNEGKLSFLIGGPAGAGIEKSGKILGMAMMRNGYQVFSNIEHRSQIRGGNNFLRLRIDKKRYDCHLEETDLIVALDKITIDEHIDEITEGGVIVYDSAGVDLGEGFDSKGVKMIDVPLKKIAEEEFGNPVMANVIGLGVVCGLIGFDIEGIIDVLDEVFEGKSAEIIKANEAAAKKGFDLAEEKWARDFPYKVKTGQGNELMFLTGNDAFSIGAVKAGCKFVGEYPMTPSSSILHFMAKWADKYGIVVKHTEDEIAACHSIIGAGFAGVRSLAATSGGGFALMTEAVGLASMNEVPIVICEVMRPGPATGQPTRSDQGDLRQVIHGGQGDPLKIVLLPGDIEECFRMGFEAFNLAEKYQMPVIVLFDKYMGESLYAVKPFDESGMVVDRGKLLSQEELDKISDYKRYLRTDDGISPRVIPGMKGGIHRASSDEHDEYGVIKEGKENRKLMMEKRMRKLEGALSDVPEPELIGEGDADVTFVTWCSCKGALIEAVSVLAEKGVKANILQIKCAIPFDAEKVKDMISGCKRPILVETNYSGQMGGLIAEHTGILLKERILRYDGRPMTARFVVDAFTPEGRVANKD